jgi:hypothetical protein
MAMRKATVRVSLDLWPMHACLPALPDGFEVLSGHVDNRQRLLSLVVTNEALPYCELDEEPLVLEWQIKKTPADAPGLFRVVASLWLGGSKLAEARPFYVER